MDAAGELEGGWAMGSWNSDGSRMIGPEHWSGACMNDCMIGDGDGTRTRRESLGKATNRRARIMGGSGGEAWSGQVCVLWHQDAASSWISLTRPSVWRQAWLA